MVDPTSFLTSKSERKLNDMALMIMFDVSFIVGPQKEVDNIMVKSFQNIEVEIQRLRANIISNITALLANLQVQTETYL